MPKRARTAKSHKATKSKSRKSKKSQKKPQAKRFKITGGGGSTTPGMDHFGRPPRGKAALKVDAAFKKKVLQSLSEEQNATGYYIVRGGNTVECKAGEQQFGVLGVIYSSDDRLALCSFSPDLDAGSSTDQGDKVFVKNCHSKLLLTTGTYGKLKADVYWAKARRAVPKDTYTSFFSLFGDLVNGNMGLVATDVITTESIGATPFMFPTFTHFFRVVNKASLMLEPGETKELEYSYPINEYVGPLGAQQSINQETYWDKGAIVIFAVIHGEVGVQNTGLSHDEFNTNPAELVGGWVNTYQCSAPSSHMDGVFGNVRLNSIANFGSQWSPSLTTANYVQSYTPIVETTVGTFI